MRDPGMHGPVPSGVRNHFQPQGALGAVSALGSEGWELQRHVSQVPTREGTQNNDACVRL